MATATKDMKKKAVKKRTTKKVTATKDSFVPTLFVEDDNDPKHQLFEAYYTNPQSPSFGNARKSAMGAGYTKSYADNLLHLRPKWISDIIGRMDTAKMAQRARQNLEEDLNMSIIEQAMGAFGPIFATDKEGKKTIPVMVRNSKFIEARQKATFFVAEKIDPLFNKSKPEGLKVDIKQIIIIAPNGSNIGQVDNTANRETVSSVSITTD